ncbi:MAG: carboxypeptidase-like regulatory domain-containing protein, partial [Odoribacter sp.]|nr:carboxypeptidase-like regulatory domain-containing protein [Odoribacter sp.]
MEKINKLPPQRRKRAVKRAKRLCLLATLVFLNALQAVCAQTTRVSVHLQNAGFEEFVHQIKQQTDYTFFYNDRIIGSIEPITLNKENAPLEEVLRETLHPKGFSFSINNHTIVIRKEAVAEPQRNTVIRGKVTDEKDAPLPGVTVQIKGTGMGVSTNHEGCYELTLPGSSEVTLIFSFIGMKTQEVLYSGETEINVTMHEEVSEMEEVVVNGYFTKNKNSFTGTAVVVTKEELSKVASSNVISALQVFDPSFRLQENIEMGSNPNSLPDFRIRGNSGFGAEGLSETRLRNDPNLPTFILDGYEVDVEKIFDLNIDRIESVTILKDASATAIYGSRAANGVVVVTTKTPEAGELKVSYNLNMTFTAPDLSDYNLLDAAGKLEAEKLSGYYASDDMYTQQLLDKDYAYRLSNVQRGVNTYWLSQPLRTAVGHKHSLYI